MTVKPQGLSWKKLRLDKKLSHVGCSHQGAQELQPHPQHHSFQQPIHWKRPWCWGRLKAGEGDDRRWDGWMASPTRWTWVWASSRSWWWAGRPGVLQPMRSQRVGHDLVVEQQEQPSNVKKKQKTTNSHSPWVIFVAVPCLSLWTGHACGWAGFISRVWHSCLQWPVYIHHHHSQHPGGGTFSGPSSDPTPGPVCCSVAQSCPTLWPRGLQHARPPCP